MNTSPSLRRMRRALLPTLALAAVVASASGIADAATTAPPTAAKQKLASCMKAKGFSVPPTQAQRANAKYRTALRACVKKSGVRATMQKYISCMKKHGVVITPGKRSSRSSAAYKKANAACASLRNT